MKKILFGAIFLCLTIYSKDNVVKVKNDNLLYIIEVLQKEMTEKKIENLKNSDIEIHLRNLEKNYFYRVGIIKLGKVENENVESHVKEGAKADINGEIFKEFNKLLTVDFSKCNLKYPVDQTGKMIKGVPRLIKKLETRVEEDGTIVYRALAVVDSETYRNFPYSDLPLPNLLKEEIKEKNYICPDYYNGE